MGYWKLEIESDSELSDSDREHIAELITEGFTEGELIEDDDDDE